MTARQRDVIWVSWLNQRRTSELAKVMALPLFTFAFGGPRPLRHARAVLSTIALLVSRRPDTLIVQNPSVVLAALACVLRPLLRYKLVVDRHSNFDFANTQTGLFNWISNFSLKRANLTIVTNDWLRALVERKGGRAIVLQDRIPQIPQTAVQPLRGRFNVLFVCSFSWDEPVDAVFAAARLVGPETVIYVTGNDRKLRGFDRATLPANVVLTGFLSAADYDALLRSCDAVMVLTTRDHTLTSGAYEAIGADKPMILTNTSALTAYFSAATVRCGNSSEELAAAMQTARNQLPELQQEVTPLRTRLNADWDERFANLQELLAKL